jgi:methyltransferase (TIGR00027 family)
VKLNHASITALQAAKHRADHQLLDDPKIFEDPLALRILGGENASILRKSTPWSTRFAGTHIFRALSSSLRVLSRTVALSQNPVPEQAKDTPKRNMFRAFSAARSRFTEDELHTALDRGICQFVILGAGLDTFAYRNPYPGGILKVFEVDHPATQIWKRKLLEEAGIPIPPTLAFIPVDFEIQTLREGLRTAGFDSNKSTFFSWLGVTYYLSIRAITETLQFIASMPAGSGIAFDYLISTSSQSSNVRRRTENLRRQLSNLGEPIRTLFEPAAIDSYLRSLGFGQIEDMASKEINSRYFRGRTDGLQVGSRFHLLHARV